MKQAANKNSIQALSRFRAQQARCINYLQQQEEKLQLTDNTADDILHTYKQDKI